MTNFSPDVMANLACWSANSFPGIPTWALTQERPTMFFALKMFDFTLLTNSDLVFALLMADIEERLSVCMLTFTFSLTAQLTANSIAANSAWNTELKVFSLNR
ncbi:hypothetical protein AVEN_138766-1 [Araneus ventricosus]|uniref:Uncharacterized protein n=1 Tax=Araneus ventricosus TaxID=182803 RepID=A0A4Y2FPK2_ARAVE|nr:hypothetical protein AVEN_138766-1 [Araneus ventricosus]